MDGFIRNMLELMFVIIWATCLLGAPFLGVYLSEKNKGFSLVIYISITVLVLMLAGAAPIIKWCIDWILR